jgi:hypothetical protein
MVQMPAGRGRAPVQHNLFGGVDEVVGKKPERRA